MHSISDLKSSSLKKAQKNYPNIETFKDYKKAIKLNKYDLVVVSTPTNTHYKITKHALSKKINVLVEKPLCNSLLSSTNFLPIRFLPNKILPQ